MKKQYFYFYWSNILLYVSVLLLKYLICVLCPPLCTTGQTEEKHQGLDCGTSQKIQQHCQGRASLLSPKPLKACAPLTHSTQSSSAGVCSDLGKEGKEKLFIAQTFFKIGLLNYDKNHNHDYFGQYCNHDYLKLLLVGHMTKTLYESFI